MKNTIYPNHLDEYIKVYPGLDPYKEEITEFCNKEKIADIRVFDWNTGIAINMDWKFIFKVPQLKNKVNGRVPDITNEIENHLNIQAKLRNYSDKITNILSYEYGQYPYYIQTLATWRSIAKYWLDLVFENTYKPKSINSMRNDLSGDNSQMAKIIRQKLSFIEGNDMQKNEIFHLLHNSELWYLMYKWQVDPDAIYERRFYVDREGSLSKEYVKERLGTLFWEQCADKIIDDVKWLKNELLDIGYIHWDLNTQNIFFDSDTTKTTIIDFGESKKIEKTS